MGALMTENQEHRTERSPKGQGRAGSRCRWSMPGTQLFLRAGMSLDGSVIHVKKGLRNRSELCEQTREQD